jgi:bacterioferritin (cytochrome b1)
MEFYNLLERIVQDNETHAKWLNTLSFMENAGARKISACEHPTKVSLIQLKHAAEEHRHAYYLKKQIGKLDPEFCKTYYGKELLASIATRQYLHSLDVKACKYLQNNFTLTKEELKYAAYLFVTYAIEVRADELYPVYQDILTKTSSKIMVKSIILEEEGHLEEMINQLDEFSENWKPHAENILKIEHELHDQWINAIIEEVAKFNYA